MLNRHKRAAAVALAAAVLFAAGPARAQSTINPTIPNAGSTVQAQQLAIQQNFQKAATDINGLLGMHAVAAQGNCPVTTFTGTDCLVTGTSPAQWFKSYAGGWALIGNLDLGTGLFSATSVGPPSPTQLGGVFSFAAPAHQWVTGVSTAGVFQSSQPSYADISGALPPSACTAATTSALGCVQGDAATLSLSGGGIISINLAHANTWTNTLSIAPPSGTLTQALNIASTGPTPACPPSSSCPTFNFNYIRANNQGYTNSSAGFDGLYLLPAVNAVRVELVTSATNGFTIPAALTAVANGTGNTPNLVGAQLVATTNAGSGNASALWGGIGYVNVGPLSSSLVSFGLEGESGAATGASILYRFGVGAASFGPTQALTLDAAFVAYQAALPSQTGWTSSAPFKNFLLLFDGYAGGSPLAPIDPTGSILTAGGVGSGTFTVANVINLPNVTVTGDIFNFQNFVLTGAGVGTLTGPSSSNILTVTATSGGNVQIGAMTNGASSFDGLQIDDSSTTRVLGLFQFEASNTGTRFGQSSGGWAGVFQFNGGAGLMLGTRNSAPVILGTNDTAWLNLSAAGLFAYTGPQQYTVAQTLASATALHWRNVYMAPATLTITGNTGSPITRLDAFSLGQQTITDSSAVTVTDAATLYIDNAPAAGGSVTITNAWALLVGAGNVKFAGSLTLGTPLGVGQGGTGAATLTGILVGNGTSAFTATQITGAVKDNGSGTLSQAACADLSGAGPGCSAAQGQIPGTTTNDGASAGNIGEYIVSGSSSFNNLLTNNSANVTITIASPGVVTWTGNPYFLSTATNKGCGAAVVFSTTGALPTGLVAGTTYYVTCDGTLTANAFHVSTSVDNAIAGTAINTSGTQSGTQSATNAIALGNGSAVDFGGMSLTAGDWDVTGVVHFVPGATTSITASLAATSSTTGLGGTLYSVLRQAQAAEVPNSVYNLGMSVERISLSGTTTIYCGTFASFSVSTLSAAGECRARRVR